MNSIFKNNMLSPKLRWYVVFAIFCILAGVNIWFIVVRHDDRNSIPALNQPQPTPTQRQDALAEHIQSARGDDHVLVVMGGSPYIPGECGELIFDYIDGKIYGITGGIVSDWENMSLRSPQGQELLLIRLEIWNSDVPLADFLGTIKSIKKAVPKDQQCVLVVYLPG